MKGRDPRRHQTLPGGVPSLQVRHSLPHYQRLLVLVGFDAADEVGLAFGQDFHQLVQGLLELACQGGGLLAGVCRLQAEAQGMWEGWEVGLGHSSPTAQWALAKGPQVGHAAFTHSLIHAPIPGSPSAY